MTDFLENMHFDEVDEAMLNEAITLDEASTFVEAIFNEATTQSTEECTSFPAFERELSGILVERALINILYDLMGCTVCGAVAKNLLAYLQHNESLYIFCPYKRGLDGGGLTLRLDPTGAITIEDNYDALSWISYTSSYRDEQFTGSVYGVACMMVHGNIFDGFVRETDIVSGLRAEHHYGQPFWWYEKEPMTNIAENGKPIIELLFGGSPDCWSSAYVAEVFGVREPLGQQQ
jgi:hypothetical protein